MQQENMQQENAIGRISKRVREGLDNGAEWVAHRKRPLDLITDKTLKLNGISHESAARLVRQQADFLEGTVEAAARRLKTASEADSFRSLVDGQIKLLPETRDRIVEDLRKTFEILGDTRTDLSQLFRETIEDLRGNRTVKSKLSEAAGNVSDAAKVAGENVVDAAEDAAEKFDEAVTH